MTEQDQELTERFNAALREPNLIIALDTNWNGRPLLRLSKPGATPRSKPVDLSPVILGDEGETHPDMLRTLAEAMESAAEPVGGEPE